MIYIGYDDCTSDTVKDLKEAQQVIQDNFDACGATPDYIYECNENGDELEDGIEYGCSWTLTALEEL